MTTAPLPIDTPPTPKRRYRAVSGWSVASLVLGVLSPTVALGWMFAVVPIAGLIAGWTGLRRIRRLREDMTGMGLAQTGIALSVLFGLGGATYQYFVVHGVPSGYTAITFADLQPDPEKPEERIPPGARELQPTDARDRKVFIKGYIHPMVTSRYLKEFVLVPSIRHCSIEFLRIQPTELIRVQVVGDGSVEFRLTEIGVGGRLEVDRNPYSRLPYVLHADYVQ